ncbi:protein translocase SEC61 complex subunit gamma [Candidatus Woesearchaeota archaeon]|nr:protein translocase SEC61 complex subunit gamma [Candidatus Woesearchaeota archaeon]
MGRLLKFKDFARESLRVLRITKKPSGFEFRTIVKVSGLGMIIIGLIGFLLHFVKQLFF